jgi:O-antigen chain-terminating methyltransferase
MHVADARDREIAQRYFQPFVGRFAGCSRVLEIASGQGFFLDMLRAAGIGATGVEADAALCEQVRARGLEVVNANFFEFLRENSSGNFDGVMASHIVEHFLPVQVEELLALLAGAAKPGSPLVILTPNIANLRRAVGDFWRDPTHVRPYPVSALSKLLRRTGWEVAESFEYTDRRPSLYRAFIYGIRNLLIGRYWGGDDLCVIARRAPR